MHKETLPCNILNMRQINHIKKQTHFHKKLTISSYKSQWVLYTSIRIEILSGTSYKKPFSQYVVVEAFCFSFCTFLYCLQFLFTCTYYFYCLKRKKYPQDSEIMGHLLLSLEFSVLKKKVYIFLKSTVLICGIKHNGIVEILCVHMDVCK